MAIVADQKTHGGERMLINWSLLGEAMSFYQGLGYAAVDAPWWVPRSVVEATCSDVSRIVSVDIPGKPREALVGSAEQSFMHLDGIGSLPSGRFVACTPCFRNEPMWDKFHLKRFVKVELYCNEVSGVGYAPLLEVVADATAFFRRHVDARFLNRVTTRDGLDLELNGIEIGSYGIRRLDDRAWVYGTGLAEPRFSMANK
jgi:hypothetical protein